MEVIHTEIEGVIIVKPIIYEDERGYFFESFSEKKFKEEVADIDFVQDNQSKSCYGVIRGLHFQKGANGQTKLVRCVRGQILDVAVDLRKDSDTYGKYVSVILTENNYKQLLIPKGFAHGFSVLSDEAIVQYKCDEFFNKESEGGINPLDMDLNINWMIPNESDIILSEKDLKYKGLKEYTDGEL